MKKHYAHLLLLALAIFAVCIQPLQAQQLAFPGAEGFGRFTTGGRGGVVYEVTNLNDAGPGSFRAGIEMSGARTIVFRVAGNIQLETDLRIRNGNLTIAGQTAPGDGVCIMKSGLVIDADNIIIRYLRIRPGDVSQRELDALWGRNRSNIIIDHCSLSWGVDEVGSFYDNKNFTLQWSILSESLFRSVHGKGDHGYGGIWGGQGATFHHNILAHHSSRNPRFNGSRYSGQPDLEIVDFRNNVLYNWGNNSAYGGEAGNHNLVNNYYKSGPATSSTVKKYRILDAHATGKWHVTGNYVHGYPTISANNWSGGVQSLSAAQIQVAKADAPFPFAPVRTQTAEEAYLSVLDSCGAIFPRRDAVDARVINEIRTGTVNFGGAYGAMKGIIDTQATVGGWPELAPGTPPVDTDRDGMPDAWEIERGLNPNDPSDRNGDANGNGYTNLEDYMNSLTISSVTSVASEVNKTVSVVYPNPFSDNLTFAFATTKQAQVSIEIFDLTGRKVKSILNAALAPGSHTYTWNGTDENGIALTSGLYLYSLQIDKERSLKRVALVKK